VYLSQSNPEHLPEEISSVFYLAVSSAGYLMLYLLSVRNYILKIFALIEEITANC
jgi:hypothetical protein